MIRPESLSGVSVPELDPVNTWTAYDKESLSGAILLHDVSERNDQPQLSVIIPEALQCHR